MNITKPTANQKIVINFLIGLILLLVISYYDQNKMNSMAYVIAILIPFIGSALVFSLLKQEYNTITKSDKRNVLIIAATLSIIILLIVRAWRSYYIIIPNVILVFLILSVFELSSKQLKKIIFIFSALSILLLIEQFSWKIALILLTLMSLVFLTRHFKKRISKFTYTIFLHQEEEINAIE